MASHNDAAYPTQITPTERAAGFALVSILNPLATRSAPLPGIGAAVCAIDAINRVVKQLPGVNDQWCLCPLGVAVFVHQRLGRRLCEGAGGPLRWVSVFDPLPCAAEAVTTARLHIGVPDPAVPLV